MSDVDLYLLKFDRNKEEATDVAKQTATRKSAPCHTTGIGNRADAPHPGLQSKELKLLTLVESLGEYLNSDEEATREKSKHAECSPPTYL